MKNLTLPKDFAYDETILEDKALRIGHLPNGLTYYIRHNEEPKNQCNIELVLKVGSLQEEDNEQGLAHFLEHMAFNGSTHFPGYNGARKYMEAHGISSSANINACTSRSYTYYYLDNVPTDKGEALLDDCIQLLADWSGELFLDGDCIERERGIIKTEYIRAGANLKRRLMDGMMDVITSGNKYAYRRPLGTLDVIEGFPYDLIRQFYKRWYVPKNQAVVIVGDVDVDAMEQKVKTMFGKYQTPEDSPNPSEYPLEMNPEPIFAYGSDKELSNTHFMVMNKFSLYDVDKVSVADSVYCEVVTAVIEIMLDWRVGKLLEAPDSPFAHLHKSIDGFFNSNSINVLAVVGLAYPGRELEAYRMVLATLQEIRTCGFSESEFQKAVQVYLSRMEKCLAERNHVPNNTFCDFLTDNFVGGEFIVSVEGGHKFCIALADVLTLDVVNSTVAEIISADGTNLVSLVYVPDNENSSCLPSADDFKSLAMEVWASDFAAADISEENLCLMPQKPEPGKIVAEQYDSLTDSYTLELSNGAKVIYKVTDFKDDEINFKIKNMSGTSQFQVQDFSNFRLMDEVLTSVGLADLTEHQLNKFYADKAIKYQLATYEYFHHIKGKSSRRDLETIMQVIYCYFCNPGHCEGDFRNFINRRRNIINNYKYQPDKIIDKRKDDLMLVDNSRNHWMTMDDVDRMDFGRILELHRQLFSDASAFDMIFVGSIDVDEFKRLAEIYLASLPSTNKGSMMRPEVVCDEYRAIHHCSQLDMVEPIAKVEVMFMKDAFQFTVRNYLLCYILDVYMDKMVGDNIRSNASISYSCGASSDIYHSQKVPGTYSACLSISAEVRPEYGMYCRNLINSVLADVVANGISSTDLANVKNEIRNMHAPNLRRNTWWIYYIGVFRKFGLELFRNLDADIDAISVDDLNAYARNIITEGTKQTYVFTPTGVEQVSAPEQQ
ncbi:MAG: insulinase family protein [Bacteroidales bacterium]|nr:insulinase family protein [Bacteroidales bacterium]